MIKGKKNSGFTLIELFVVVVIIAVLALIAFLSFSNKSSGARDSARLTDIDNMMSSLGLYQRISGKFPLPEKKVSIYSGGLLMGYQGEIGATILKDIKFPKGGGKDPLDKVYYTYATNGNQDKYQILTFLENNRKIAINNLNPFEGISTAFAVNYTNRYPYEKGDDLGIILSKTTITTGTDSGAISYIPVQDIPSIQTSASGFVITNPAINTGMVAIINNVLTETGVTVKSLTGYTIPVNPVEAIPVVVSPIVVTSGDQIKEDTDLNNISGSGITYIFSSGSYYVKNWTTNGCNPNILKIDTAFFVPGNLDPKTLSGNTIYKVPNGTYLLSGSTSTNGHIKFNGNCIALIGESTEGVIFKGALTGGASPGYGNIMINGRNNNIVTNLKIDGNKSSSYRYNYGIEIIGGSNNTLNKIDSYNNYSYGVFFVSTSNNSIYNSLMHDNTTIGMVAAAAPSSIIINMKTYRNGSYGIALQSSAHNSIIINTLNHDNGQLGIMISDSSNSIVNNSQNFNNLNYGIYILGTAYNNTVNNVQNYNNGNYGVYLSSQNNTLNNIQNYNHSMNGMYLNASNNSLNNVEDYNSLWYGIKANVGVTGNKFYGTLRMFGNDSGNYNGTNLNDLVLSQGTGSSLGWADGTISTGAITMNCAYHSQPDILASWGTCTGRGQVTSITFPATSYSYGPNILNQVQPVKCPTGQTCANGANLQLYGASGTDWDPTKKIGEW